MYSIYQPTGMFPFFSCIDMGLDQTFSAQVNGSEIDSYQIAIKKLDNTELWNSGKSAMVGIKYQVEVGLNGWQNWVQDGEMAGTTGQSLRLEGIKIELVNPLPGANIKYQAYIQGTGWQDVVSNGQLAGTEWEGLRMEAVKIWVENMPRCSVKYQAHVENIGWQDWVSDGEIAGTTGQAKRMEAIRIKIEVDGLPLAEHSYDKDILQVTIPANTITVRDDLKWQLTYWNGTESISSSEIIFRNMTTPSIGFTVPNLLNNKQYNFTAAYSQPENVRIKRWNMNLYAIKYDVDCGKVGNTIKGKNINCGHVGDTVNGIHIDCGYT